MGVPLHFANVLVDPPRREVRERGEGADQRRRGARHALLAVGCCRACVRVAQVEIFSPWGAPEAFSDFSPTLMTYMI